MPVGFESYNDSGITQITDQTKSLVLVGRGTTALPANTFVDITSSGHFAPLLFIRPSGGASVAISFRSKIGAAYLWQFISATACTVEWFVYDLQPYAPSISGVGLEVYKEDGSLAYSTAYKPLTILSATPIPRAGGPTNLGTAAVAYPAGRTVAVCNSIDRSRETTASGAPVYMEGASIHAGEVRLDGGQVFIQEYADDWDPYYHGNLTVLMIADVTGVI